MESNEILRKEPIRIAHVIGKLNAGGVEAVITNYYKNIDRNKFQFDFFIDSDSQFTPSKEIIELGARYYVIPPYQSLIKHLNALIRHFKENKYYIVHSSMNTLSVISLFAAWRAGVPIRINHNHSTASKGETKKNIAKYILRPFATLFATDYCACSRYAGEWLFGKKKMSEGMVEIFNNAIDIKKYDYNEKIRSQVRAMLNLKDKLVVGHVGRFCFQKNQEFLIDIFKLLKEKHEKAALVLIGAGETETQIKDKVRNLNLEDSVLFLGTVNDVYNYYQAMDVFVLPSRYEGLPVVGVEAQAAGLTCLFSTNMTDETKITKHTLMIDLNKGADYWSEQILINSIMERSHTLSDIIAAGFDIKSQAKHLEKYYEDRLNRF